MTAHNTPPIFSEDDALARGEFEREFAALPLDKASRLGGFYYVDERVQIMWAGWFAGWKAALRRN